MASNETRGTRSARGGGEELTAREAAAGEAAAGEATAGEATDGEAKTRSADAPMTEQEVAFPQSTLDSPLLHSFPCAVISCDLVGNVTTWNRAAEQSLGWSQEEILGRPCPFIHREDEARFSEILAMIRDGERPPREELRGVRKNGALIKVRLGTSPIVKADGEVMGVLVAVIDITTREEVAEKELWRRNRFIEIILDNLPIGLAVNTIDKGSMGYVNGRFLEIYGGWSDSDFTDLDTFFAKVYPDPNERERVRRMMLEDIASGDPDRMRWEDIQITATDGNKRIINVANIPLPEQNIMISTVQDVTDRKLAEDALRESERRYHMMAEASPVGIFRSDLRGRCRYVNRRWREIAGLTAADALDESWVVAVHPDERKDVVATWELAVGERRTFQTECRFKRPGGSSAWVFVQAEPVFDLHNDVTGYIGTVTDISERKRSEEEIRQLAYYDGLTKLPNRAFFMEQLERALGTARRAENHIALLFCDLDNFKDINDSLGHDKGDLLLKLIAHRLSACIRKGDTLCRLGGDEFVLLLPAVAQDKEVVSVARKIQRTMGDPFDLDGHTVFTTTSIGIAMFPEDGADVQTLLKHADMAMYAAKAKGRNRYRFFSEDMNRRAVRRLELEAGLRRALEHNEFVLEYQPQYDLRDGQLIGAEALVRWNHPERGMILPGQFIPVAEETGLIHDIGDWVLRTACHQATTWRRAGFPPLRIAVNLSVHEFLEDGLRDRVRTILEETEHDPNLLELEITEGILMKDADVAIKTLRKLRNDGVKVAIDDFGTGYSSLIYLKRFPVDRIKIAQEFIRDIDHDSDDAAIAEMVIGMAENLNLQAIAEGVETAEQADMLRKLNCPAVQGFYFDRPLTADDFSSRFEAAD